MGYIYKITNLINNKIYVGKTIKSLEQRFSEHKHEAERYAEDRIHFGYKTKFYPAIVKYGVSNFSISLLEEVEDSELNEREAYWISKLNCLDDNIGYNISPGGLGGPLFKGHHHTEISKQRISLRLKGKVSNRLGVEMSQAQKDKIRNSLHRYHLTLESRVILSNAARLSWKTRRENGNTRTTNGMHIYNNGKTEMWAYSAPEGFVEGRLPEIKQKTSASLQRYFKMLPPEVIQQRCEKAAQTRNNWSSEKKSEVCDRISIASRNHWKEMSQESLYERSKKVSNSMKQYHANLTPEEKQLRSVKNSLGQKGKKRYYNVTTGAHKMFYPDNVPEGWKLIEKSKMK